MFSGTYKPVKIGGFLCASLHVLPLGAFSVQQRHSLGVIFRSKEIKE